ncbi:PASTA domain-containing protein [Nocardia cyriacigeorgica]|uniref:PASTA domain-containing protein n=1 Tax=Nocardia cyriacigeorgica TaxID=135487 RepID=UPI00189377F0|nr:PASTA domain-containing protein [Nocardia cyriacigeorgica]MBF6094957.1 PASTA domain-containing protein [Nocardia cyriacigeorgica]
MIKPLQDRIRRAARGLPAWKFRTATALLAFFIFGAAASPFIDGLGLTGSMTYLGLALLPAAYLARAATRTAADTHPASTEESAPHARFNWTIAMVVAAVALLVGAAALDRGIEETRDPNAVMPDIVGMSLPDANDALDRLDLDVTTYDATNDDRKVWIESNWIVAEQKPPAGTKLGDLTAVEVGVVKTGESRATTTRPPTRDACRMIDPDALAAAKMSARLQPPRQSTPSGADDTPTYGCANDLDEVTLEVHLYPTHEAARTNAEYATRPEILTGPYSPYAKATRIPFASSFAGAKVISTDTGVSRVSWSVGPYLLLLEINSDPVIPHLTPRHPFDVLDTLIDTIFQQANAVLAEGDW